MLSRCWRKVLRDRDRAVSLNQPCPRRVNHRFNLFGVCSSFLSIYLSVFDISLHFIYGSGRVTNCSSG